MGYGKEEFSPLTCSVLDDLSKKLNNVNAGCFMGTELINNLMYADDLVILAPSQGGAVAEWVRASIGDRTIDGSTPTAGDFEFGTLAIPLTLLCQCLSDETLKAVGPFYLVSMPGEVNDPTSPHWNV